MNLQRSAFPFFLLLLLATPSVGLAQATLSTTVYTTAGRPTSIATGPDGALWFTEPVTGKIGRITTAGVLTEYKAPSSTAGERLTGITAGPDGALWLTDFGQIDRITTDGESSAYPLPSQNANPNSIAAGPDGALWFTDTGYIGRITTDGTVTEFPIAATYEGEPTSDVAEDIVAGPDGALWFTEIRGAGKGGAIGRITTSGIVSHYTVPTSGGATESIAVGSDGALWFTEAFINKIGRITTAGVVTEYSQGSSNAVLDGGIAAGPDGNLWFPNQYGLGRMTTDGAFTQYGSASPGGITTGPDGALWFATGNSIGRGVLTPAPGPFLVPAPLPGGYPGTAYSASISASGGTPPYTGWQIASGSLPPGLGLSASTGEISGTPSAVGSWTFTIAVQDASGAKSAGWTFSITVSPAGCSYAVNPPGPFFPASGGTGTITITAGAGCAWIVSTPLDWITLSSAPSGTGNGDVTFQVSANLDKVRSNSLLIGGQISGGAPQVFTVLQQAGNTNYPPQISGVLDAESARPTVVPGEWVSIYGTRLFEGAYATWTKADFGAAGPGRLPTVLGGVTVQFGGIPAAICYVSTDQINAQVPLGISGTVPVVVTTDAISNSFPVTVVQNAPSLYFYSAGSNFYAAAVHADGTLIGDPSTMPGATRARAGEIILLFVNGIAPSPSGVIINSPIPYSGATSVTIGSAAATPIFTGLVEAGVYQINVAVPGILTTGDYPVTIAVEGQVSPLNVVLPVQ